MALEESALEALDQFAIAVHQVGERERAGAEVVGHARRMLRRQDL